MTNTDGQRDLTLEEERLADELRSPNPAWVAYWSDAGFSDDQVRDWWPVIEEGLLSFSPEWAARLRAAGWSPSQVKAAQEGQTVQVQYPRPHHRLAAGWVDGPPVVDARKGLEAGKAALVLTQYLYLVAECRAVAAAEMRALLLGQLMDDGVPDPEAAALIGLTKQRVGTILKPRRRLHALDRSIRRGRDR